VRFKKATLVVLLYQIFSKLTTAKEITGKYLFKTIRKLQAEFFRHVINWKI